jgi:amidase
LVAKTCTDELAYSLDGINIHYGTPINPQAPNRIPGGSSSGSASVVAQGTVDFALGTDTSGSIRVPASYCGLYSMRPSHERVSSEGVMALAPGFDTVGWLARSAETLALVGEILLTEPDEPGETDDSHIQLTFLEDAFAIAHESIAPYLVQACQRLKQQFEHDDSLTLKTVGALETWSQGYRILQAVDVWKTFGDWISKCEPTFAPEIAERFAFACEMKKSASNRPTGNSQWKKALPVWAEAYENVCSALKKNRIICLPTTWNLAPLLNSSPEELNANRSQNFKLTCLSTLSGAPQLTIPVPGPDGLSIGLSFIGGINRDRQLLHLAKNLAAVQWAERP